MLPFMCLAMFGPANFQNGPDLFNQVISRPTGQNAYEDYVRAAEVVSDPQFGVYINWPYIQDYGTTSPDDTPEIRQKEIAEGQAAAGLKGKTYLQAMRMCVQRYGGALDIVREGLLKKAWQPRQTLTPDTSFPEFQWFKALERLFMADAYVKFADGQGDLASDDLIDGLKFARHMPAGPIIAPLVSIAMESIAFRVIQRNIGSISETGWSKIVDLCDKQLADNSFLADSILFDRKGVDSALDMVKSSLSSLAPYLNGAEKSISSLTPDQQQNLFAEARANIDQYYSDVSQAFAGSESDFRLPEPPWPQTPEGTPSSPTYADLLHGIEDSLTVNFENIAGVSGRTRAQWRVLRLHALVQLYRWENQRLPTDIHLAADASDLADPLSGTTLVYQLVDDDNYRIYSKGTKSIGEVGLIYRNPQLSQAGAPRTP